MTSIEPRPVLLDAQLHYCLDALIVTSQSRRIRNSLSLHAFIFLASKPAASLELFRVIGMFMYAFRVHSPFFCDARGKNEAHGRLVEGPQASVGADELGIKSQDCYYMCVIL